MAQVKKSERRDAILDSAARLFRENGYLKCRMEEIAADAGTAVANLYVYFPSKLHLFYAVWTPMMKARMLKLARDAREIQDPKQRLRFIFLSLWQDIPREDNAFANNLIQAIATATSDIEKPHDILKWCEEFLNELIQECLPRRRRFLAMDTKISFLSWMAFDGFVVNVGKNEDRDMDTLVNHFADLLLGQTYAEEI
ncbi:MAG: TetR/AcrR family transcriptional regulator [Woeseia sp.]